MLSRCLGTASCVEPWMSLEGRCPGTLTPIRPRTPSVLRVPLRGCFRSQCWFRVGRKCTSDWGPHSRATRVPPTSPETGWQESFHRELFVVRSAGSWIPDASCPVPGRGHAHAHHPGNDCHHADWRTGVHVLRRAGRCRSWCNLANHRQPEPASRPVARCRDLHRDSGRRQCGHQRLGRKRVLPGHLAGPERVCPW